MALTHWVTTASFLGFPLIPSLQAYLGASKLLLGAAAAYAMGLADVTSPTQ